MVVWEKLPCGEENKPENISSLPEFLQKQPKHRRWANGEKAQLLEESATKDLTA